MEAERRESQRPS